MQRSSLPRPALQDGLGVGSDPSGHLAEEPVDQGGHRRLPGYEPGQKEAGHDRATAVRDDVGDHRDGGRGELIERRRRAGKIGSLDHEAGLDTSRVVRVQGALGRGQDEDVRRHVQPGFLETEDLNSGRQGRAIDGVV